VLAEAGALLRRGDIALIRARWDERESLNTPGFWLNAPWMTADGARDRDRGRGVRLAGRAALVTGGGSGIGAGIAERLAREGAAVLVADIKAEPAERIAAELTAAGLTAASFRMDVTREADCEAAVAEAEARFGPLRIAVCNAGIADRSPALEIAFATFEHIVRTNLFGCFLSARAAARAMVRADPPGGRIVTVSSVSGQFGGTGRVAYGASKGGIEMLTKVLAVEFAGAVAFLCSGDAAFVTGHMLDVDGGFAATGVLYDPKDGD
jgi:3-oxoacyl-[acyl-carrier protein] reductase